jgi:hypothetical protein
MALGLPVTAQPRKNSLKFVVDPGPPDLTVQLSALPTRFDAFYQSSIISIRLQNNLTMVAPEKPNLPGPPLENPTSADGAIHFLGGVAGGEDPRSFPVPGEPTRKIPVSVLVQIPPELSVAGNLLASPGFQCYLVPNTSDVVCSGERLEPTKSAVFLIEVVTKFCVSGLRADPNYSQPTNPHPDPQHTRWIKVYPIKVVVDPEHRIRESSETNNNAGADITVDYRNFCPQ